MIHIFRHLESQANEKKLYGTDLPLSEKDLDRLPSDIIPDILITSSKVRAIETARILFPKKKIDNVNKIFDEIYFGVLEGTHIEWDSYSEICEIRPESIFSKYNGDNIWERARKALEYIEMIDSDKNICIISHGTLFRSICEYIRRENKPYIILDDNGEKFIDFTTRIKNGEHFRIKRI